MSSTTWLNHFVLFLQILILMPISVSMFYRFFSHVQTIVIIPLLTIYISYFNSSFFRNLISNSMPSCFPSVLLRNLISIALILPLFLFVMIHVSALHICLKYASYIPVVHHVGISLFRCIPFVIIKIKNHVVFG